MKINVRLYGSLAIWGGCIFLYLAYLKAIVTFLPRQAHHSQYESSLPMINQYAQATPGRFNTRQFMLEKFSRDRLEDDGVQTVITDPDSPNWYYGTAKDRLLDYTDDIGSTPQWTTPMEFIQACDDLSGPFPPDHPSKLAPLFRSGTKEFNTSRVMAILARFEDRREYETIASEEPVPCVRWNLLHPPPAASTHPKIGIVMVVNGTSSQLAQKSLLDKQEYAAKHGYGLHIFNQLEPSRDIAWSKLPAMLAVAPKYDWLWSVDLDTIILDPDRKLESFIDPRYDIITSLDRNGINLGSFFTSTRNWTKIFLATAWIKTHTSKAYWQWWHEQAAFMDLSEDFRIRSHMKFIPNRGLNSYVQGRFGNLYQQGDFLVHFPGLGDKKMVRFEQYWRVRSGEQLAPEEQPGAEEEEEWEVGSGSFDVFDANFVEGDYVDYERFYV